MCINIRWQYVGPNKVFAQHNGIAVKAVILLGCGAHSLFYLSFYLIFGVGEGGNAKLG
jgi:hypothetical protein